MELALSERSASLPDPGRLARLAGLACGEKKP